MKTPESESAKLEKQAVATTTTVKDDVAKELFQAEQASSAAVEREVSEATEPVAKGNDALEPQVAAEESQSSVPAAVAVEARGSQDAGNKGEDKEDEDEEEEEVIALVDSDEDGAVEEDNAGIATAGDDRDDDNDNDEEEEEEEDIAAYVRPLSPSSPVCSLSLRLTHTPSLLCSCHSDRCYWRHPD